MEPSKLVESEYTEGSIPSEWDGNVGGFSGGWWGYLAKSALVSRPD